MRKIDSAPPGFRPGAWSSEIVLWGRVRDKLTQLDTPTGRVRSYPHAVWSLHAADGALSWRNGTGTWMMGDGAEPVLLAPAGADPGIDIDGPPDPLWSRDGSRVLLEWHGEGVERHELVTPGGPRRRLTLGLPGYFGNDAVLWLDSTRVLFETVATGPIGAAPEYRESGWRRDLAVLDVSSGAYTRITSVADGVVLRVVGPYYNDVLVAEFARDSVRGHWLYDPRIRRGRAISLPKGRAFASRAGAIVVLTDAEGDSAAAILLAGRDTIKLGRVSDDAEPAFSPSGRRGAIGTSAGPVIFERPVP